MDSRMFFNVVQHLHPDMLDFDADMMYYMTYAEELDELVFIVAEEGPEKAVEHVNTIIRTKLSTDAKHHAMVDVGSTLVGLYGSSFVGKFTF